MRRGMDCPANAALDPPQAVQAAACGGLIGLVKAFFYLMRPSMPVSQKHQPTARQLVNDAATSEELDLEDEFDDDSEQGKKKLSGKKIVLFFVLPAVIVMGAGIGCRAKARR